MRYGKDEIRKYRNQTQKLIKNMPNNPFKIRCTDNNGQIAQYEACNSIGKWTISKINAKEMEETTLKPSNGAIYVAQIHSTPFKYR